MRRHHRRRGLQNIGGGALLWPRRTQMLREGIESFPVGPILSVQHDIATPNGIWTGRKSKEVEGEVDPSGEEEKNT